MPQGVGLHSAVCATQRAGGTASEWAQGNAPTGSGSARAGSRWAMVDGVLGMAAVMPQPIEAGVFGMARTMAVFGAR